MGFKCQRRRNIATVFGFKSQFPYAQKSESYQFLIDNVFGGIDMTHRVCQIKCVSKFITQNILGIYPLIDHGEEAGS